jgi:benzodiazapine receptor
VSASPARTALGEEKIPALRDVLGLAGFVLLCFGVSLLGSIPAASAVPEWYASLERPAWGPPSWVFGPVWTVLYPLIAVAGWLVWREGRSRTATLLYLLQLALNAAWPWIFFGMRRPDLAFLDIVALVAAIASTIVVFTRKSQTAARLLVPYLAWVLFAAALNLAVWRLNP